MNMAWTRHVCWAAILIACAASWVAAAETSPSPLGKKVENFLLPNTYGQTVSLADYDGKLVVLAFVGTECPLAKNYASRLRDLAAEFEKEGVVFLGIDANLQDSLTEIGAFALANEMAGNALTAAETMAEHARSVAESMAELADQLAKEALAKTA